MLKPTSWAWAACIVVFASGGGEKPLAGVEPAPPPKEKPADEAWFPTFVNNKEKVGFRTGIEAPAPLPPSAFPDLVLPEWDPKNPKKRNEVFEKMCPRLTTNAALKIEPTDNALQKLLKSRLQQGVLEYRRHRNIERGPIQGPAPPFTPPFECLTDIRATALELWAGQPKELVPWLEELVVAANDQERYTRLRTEAGALTPQQLHYATRHRLKAEADLWKAKNANARREDPPAKKDGKEEKPAEGDWLADKKLPPSLFPDIGLPVPVLSDPNYGWGALIAIKRAAQYAQLCPRLSGKTGLKIEDGDSTLQKLLKARLHQGALQIQRHRADEPTRGFRGGWGDSPLWYDCLDDMRAAAVELWGKQPKELAPWLEELLVEAKDFERGVLLRVEAGQLRPVELNPATRHRLKIEAELWKAKNAK